MAQQLKVDPQTYNNFVRGLDPRDLRLVSAQVEAPSKYLGGELTGKVDVGLATYIPQEGGFAARHTLVFEGRCSDSEDVCVTLKVVFEIGYRSETEISDDLFTVFQRVNLPVNTWPYFREFVQSSLARAGWPTTVLPAFHLGGSTLEPPAEIEPSR
jgi:hypothetical protein